MAMAAESETHKSETNASIHVNSAGNEPFMKSCIALQLSLPTDAVRARRRR
jgi:hypothetical protein